MDWCTHCLMLCRANIDSDGGFVCCSSCGKVLGQVSVKKSSDFRSRRFKRAKKSRLAIVEVDPSFHESTISADCSNEDLAARELIQRLEQMPSLEVSPSCEQQ